MSLRIAAVVITAMAMAAIGSPAPAHSNPQPCYISKTAGDCVPGPEPGTAPSGKPTSICKDGDHWCSEHHSGTCSSHGGVGQWLS
jgi:Protein of unknown function (DUF3761)